jgi:hypothetical protein
MRQKRHFGRVSGGPEVAQRNHQLVGLGTEHNLIWLHGDHSPARNLAIAVNPDTKRVLLGGQERFRRCSGYEDTLEDNIPATRSDWESWHWSGRGRGLPAAREQWSLQDVFKIALSAGFDGGFCGCAQTKNRKCHCR